MVGAVEDETSADPTVDVPDEALVGEPVSTEGATDVEDEGEEPAEEPDWAVLAEEDPRSPGELLAELTEAEARRDEYLEDVRRARAEFENYRKRVMREGTAQREQGRADVVARLLDVLDDFDRTLQAAGPGAEESFVKGVSLVHDKLVATLRDLGLQRIDEVGVPFDPNRHEAVQQVEAEETTEEPRVAQLFRPGYELGGRVLRAAMVVVEQ
ncbi:MAG: nucleotide exchange factor GrpE [Actinobacteria bacterium]|nr:nucleotide exchange factor GrpE [Actinomycetota bacterium]